jgi:hypothetical protein
MLQMVIICDLFWGGGKEKNIFFNLVFCQSSVKFVERILNDLYF